VSGGFYQLEPGEAAVVLRLGRYDRTVTEPGLKWHLPAPLEYAETVNVTEIRRARFGLQGDVAPAPGVQTANFESAIQTADSNIVNLSYVLQYRVDDAFAFLYGMASPDTTLHDATQAAVREVVGRRSVDAVLSAERASLQVEAREILEELLASYFTNPDVRSAFEIRAIQLQVVQPPAAVQDAFDDVIAAQQDGTRAVSVAQGDAREIKERAGAEAVEIVEAARGYRDALVLDARGEATRFEALVVEYQRAPQVTRRRLYLETMERVLPGVEKLVIEPDTVSLFPMLPFQRPPIVAPAEPLPAVAAGPAAPPAGPEEGAK